MRRRRTARPASSGWRNNRWRPQRVELGIAGDSVTVDYVAEPDGGFAVQVGGVAGRAIVHHAASDRLDVEIDGVRRRFTVATAGDVVAVHVLGTTEMVEVPRLPAGRREEVAGGCVAPMTGVVRAVHVAKGDRVTSRCSSSSKP